ncbi:hypothetical protein ASPZODRAFT_13072 [Penicilliopsis zonata CBS 506.65]|uniref:N-acetyltransferase domain-containing protein n=1 Tax=Penicilliopsis zonata CBS 506.65 TaxID=1073090 RepID=A0A1L9SS94_9EURO|nr:hypothetical protein ASPZODRAFT_13072 [Penicilliopsis zonata CBS 506.65]OJJ49967.1 hypothetical protein ASPZODRAFT_13072 [Penicilliopsis zonata CBS 506.65]
MKPFYTHTTDLSDLDHPVVEIRSLALPLTLRVPHGEGDVSALTSILNNEENTKDDLSVATASKEELEEISRKWTKVTHPLSYMNFLMLMTEGASLEPIGLAGMGWIGPVNQAAEQASPQAGAAGVVVNPSARRKGYGHEALRMVIDYGIRELGLAEVRIGTNSKNTGMKRLIERFGLKFEAGAVVDKFGNDFNWTIRRDDWLVLGE